MIQLSQVLENTLNPDEHALSFKISVSKEASQVFTLSRTEVIDVNKLIYNMLHVPMCASAHLNAY